MIRVPQLDKHFLPIEAALRDYERKVASHPSQEIALVVSHASGSYVYNYRAFADGVDDERNLLIAEKLAKTLLWTMGGHKIGIYGSETIYKGLRERFSREGTRAFDVDFMEGIYESAFVVEKLEKVQIPKPEDTSVPAGGHLDGCRIGFDAGGSDRKVSAVIDGVPVYSEEVVWNPKTTEDPQYHYDGILIAMKTAASKMPRVDAIGVSSAGVYVDNKIMAASLFLKVDKKKHGEFVKNMYINVAKEFGDVPLVVANDGDVTALAGSMSTGQNRVLGIAMGTSEAAGYINRRGGLNGWLSELAFVPVDLNPKAMVDEWSGDRGVGCKYFSQDAVIKLAEAGGYKFAEGLTPAEKLKEVQALTAADHPLARQIFEDMGIYFAHALAFYSRFYDIGLVLMLGRVTGGKGGLILLDSCKRALAEEYPELKFEISLPDEKNRRVGQSIAAASLPAIK